HVISSGHAPRRFVEDLLERLRDLIVVLAAGDQAGSVLRTVPDDQLERMRTQAQNLGLANASRAADLTNLALTEMVGATSPRLQLELLCARLLLPAADDGVDGVNARLERLESGAAIPTRPTAERPTVAAEPIPVRTVPVESAPAAPAPAAPAPQPTPAPQPVVQAAPEPTPAVDSAPPAEAAPAPAASEPAAPAPPAPADGGEQGLTTEQVRRRWPEVLATLAQLKRITWALVQNAQVVEIGNGVLTIGFPTSGLVSTFRTGPHTEPLQRAVVETLGLQVRIDVVVADGSAPARPAGGGGAPAAAPAAAPVDRAAEAAADWARPARPPAAERPAPQQAERQPAPPSDRRPPWEDDPGEPPAEEPPPADEPPAEPPPESRREQAMRAAREAPPPIHVVDEPDASDPNLEDSGLVGAPLVARMLGATVIDEYTEEERP